MASASSVASLAIGSSIKVPAMASIGSNLPALTLPHRAPARKSRQPRVWPPLQQGGSNERQPGATASVPLQRCGAIGDNFLTWIKSDIRGSGDADTDNWSGIVAMTLSARLLVPSEAPFSYGNQPPGRVAPR